MIFKAGGTGLYSPTLSTSVVSLKFPRLKGKLKKKVLLSGTIYALLLCLFRSHKR